MTSKRKIPTGLSGYMLPPYEVTPSLPWDDGTRAIASKFIRQFVLLLRADHALIKPGWAHTVISIAKKYGKFRLSDKQMRVLYQAALEDHEMDLAPKRKLKEW